MKLYACDLKVCEQGGRTNVLGAVTATDRLGKYWRRIIVLGLLMGCDYTKTKNITSISL